MISYSVDSSVYALPDMAASSGEEINEYLRSLLKLAGLIKREDIRIFLFQKDLRFLIDNKMWPNADKINRLRQKANSQNYDPKRVVSSFLRTIQDALQSGNDTESEYTNGAKRQIFFDNWFHLKKIEIEDANIETSDCPEDARPVPDSLAKNMSTVAWLNRFVYTDPGKHRLIVSKNFLKNDSVTMQISSTIKKITTDSLRDRRGQSLNVNVNYVIPGTPTENVRLEHEKVRISTLDNIDNNRFSDILSAVEAAKREFVYKTQTLIFGIDTDAGIKEYSRTLKSKKQNKNLSNKAEYMANALYSHLEALNDFVLYLRRREKMPEGVNKSAPVKRPNPCCCGSFYCEFSDVCKSFIYFLGVKCSDENQKQLENYKKMAAERMRGNGKGGKELFRLHLKPHTEPCYSDLLFLTLRIYFKWDNKEKKITVGWLGRHLYLPLKCPPHMNSCWRWDKGCPANVHRRFKS
jgi:hypothetical protein